MLIEALRIGFRCRADSRWAKGIVALVLRENAYAEYVLTRVNQILLSALSAFQRARLVPVRLCLRLLSVQLAPPWPTTCSCRLHRRSAQVAQADQFVGDDVHAKHHTHLVAASQLVPVARSACGLGGNWRRPPTSSSSQTAS